MHLIFKKEFSKLCIEIQKKKKKLRAQDTCKPNNKFKIKAGPFWAYYLVYMCLELL